ncbi:hypothetical protein SAMN05421881_101010 [Nitrosomonas halophila]|uniref:Uncharacterized protein n=1 Tax=Nitrosomonas halophila TaxID=44576 RepID=A0A1H3F1A7_9PROT|nr:hypothetical protein SAMN05421881_101010 [Nitrosomonas halophila]
MHLQLRHNTLRFHRDGCGKVNFKEARLADHECFDARAQGRPERPVYRIMFPGSVERKKSYVKLSPADLTIAQCIKSRQHIHSIRSLPAL